MGLGSLTYVGPGENVFLFIPNLIGYLRVVLLKVRADASASEVYCATRTSPSAEGRNGYGLAITAR